MPKPSAFMTFATEWKRLNAPNISPAEAVKRASPFWEKMGPEERKVYAEKSMNINLEPNNKIKKGLSTCMRTSIEMELKDQNAKKQKEQLEIDTIQKTIRNARGLENQRFYFIFVNFFIPENAVPAEIALVEFTLKDGVCRDNHWFINPQADFYGMLHTAKKHVSATHQLPLPPNALGKKTPHEIYSEILEFLNIDTRLSAAFADYPPLYTYNTCVQPVEKSLGSLVAGRSSGAKILKIYSIQHLFYLLKCATSEKKGEPIKNIYVTNMLFDRDAFEFEEDIACQYHQDIDRSRYCALSKVIRWAYTFADHILSDLNLEFIPGKHCPKNTFKSSKGKSDAVYAGTSNDCENEETMPTEPVEMGKPNLNLEAFQTSFYSKHDFTVPECHLPYNQWKRNDPLLPPDARHFDLDPMDNDPHEKQLQKPNMSLPRGRGIAFLDEKTLPKFGLGRGRGQLISGRGIAILNQTGLSDLSSFERLPRS